MENGWFHQGLGDSCGAELGAELEGCGWEVGRGAGSEGANTSRKPHLGLRGKQSLTF